MDYEVGSVADLISGLHTPNRERVVCKAFTPRKGSRKEEPVTPQESPARKGGVKTPRIAFTPDNATRRTAASAFDSPKSAPRRRKDDHPLTIMTKTPEKLKNNNHKHIQMHDDKSEGKSKKKQFKKKQNYSEKVMKPAQTDANPISKSFEKHDESIEPDADIEAHKKKLKKAKETDSDTKKKLKKVKETDLDTKKKSKRKHSDDTMEDGEPQDKEPKLDIENVSNDVEVNDELTPFQIAAQRRIQLKMKRELKFEPEQVNRTIFVGNIPVSILNGKYKKVLKKIFSKHGEIESIRFRNIPVDDLKTRPKVAFIEKKFHPNRSTVSAYVKFTQEESVEKAMVENNTYLEGNHIRVDSCSNDNKTKSDNRKTLFLGNLPFNVEEETIRDIFEKCGGIQSVRIVRDRKTQIGKGFGFINFEKVDGVELALNMSEEDLKCGKTVIRVKRYNSQPSNNVSNSYRDTSANTMGSNENENRKKLNGKKRDMHGNKIRKRNLDGKGNSKPAEESDTKQENVPKKKEFKDFKDRQQTYKGLIAKKKKKMKSDKLNLKKKRISKILLHSNN